MKCQWRRLITTEGSGKYRNAHLKTFSQHVCNGTENSLAEMLCRNKELLRRTRESWGTEGIGVSECVYGWANERADGNIDLHTEFSISSSMNVETVHCAAWLLSLFQVLKSTRWKLLKIFFLFSKFILFHRSLLLLLRIVLY